jgi:hypothetical protein
MSNVIGVFLLYEKGPNHLTRDEAERIASVCFLDHDHEANQPQPTKYWVRMADKPLYTA